LVYIILLKWINPPITITQIDSLLSGYGLKRDYVSNKNISKEIKLAVIAAEDQKFATHYGLDMESIKKVLDKTKNNKFSRGASTISQQTAKNVFLWQGRSWIRKGLEVYFTFMIELIWGKERILSVYLNCIEMDQGVFGIEAAANHYFNKSAKILTKKEASYIAATLPNPKKYTIIPLSRYILKRSRWIRNQMNHLQSEPNIKEIIIN
jgi:monofunctional biosynthetic peptidoglycan transglycosylase